MGSKLNEGTALIEAAMKVANNDRNGEKIFGFPSEFLKLETSIYKTSLSQPNFAIHGKKHL